MRDLNDTKILELLSDVFPGRPAALLSTLIASIPEEAQNLSLKQKLESNIYPRKLLMLRGSILNHKTRLILEAGAVFWLESNDQWHGFGEGNLLLPLPNESGKLDFIEERLANTLKELQQAQNKLLLSDTKQKLEDLSLSLFPPDPEKPKAPIPEISELKKEAARIFQSEEAIRAVKVIQPILNPNTERYAVLYREIKATFSIEPTHDQSSPKNLAQLLLLLKEIGLCHQPKTSLRPKTNFLWKDLHGLDRFSPLATGEEFSATEFIPLFRSFVGKADVLAHLLRPNKSFAFKFLAYLGLSAALVCLLWANPILLGLGQAPLFSFWSSFPAELTVSPYLASVFAGVSLLSVFATLFRPDRSSWLQVGVRAGGFALPVFYHQVFSLLPVLLLSGLFLLITLKTYIFMSLLACSLGLCFFVANPSSKESLPKLNTENLFALEAHFLQKLAQSKLPVDFGLIFTGLLASIFLGAELFAVNGLGFWRGVFSLSFALLVPLSYALAKRGAKLGAFSFSVTKPMPSEGLITLQGEDLLALGKDITVTTGAGESQIFEDLGFSLARGERICLLGSSGAGKSSFFSLLTAQVPLAAGQLALKAVQPFSQSIHYGLASSEPLIVAGSLEENLILGQDHPGTGKLVRAFMICELADLQRDKGQGLEQGLSAGGPELSASQRARLSLARAILWEPELFLLDGIFDLLDPRAAKRIFERLIATFPKASLLFTANNPELHALSDRLFVLARAKIIESGTLAELQTKSGWYSQLMNQNDR